MHLSPVVAVFPLVLCLACGASDNLLDGTEEPTVDAAQKPPKDCADSDGDGLCDEDEATYGADPAKPDTDGDGLSDGDEVDLGTDPTKVDTDGDGIEDAQEVVLGTDPKVPDEACAHTGAEAMAVRRPVDIIFTIDNSGSMTQEIQAIEQNINQEFSAIIAASDVDYRIVMLSQHGDSFNENICVAAPLSGHSCSPVPPVPTLTDTYKHYSEEIQSNNSLTKILETFDEEDSLGLAPNGWSEWLRDGAFKIFVEFTDDDQRGRMTATRFDEELRALSPAHFGSEQDRSYIFHSIVGVDNKDPSDRSIPHGPSDPVVDVKCRTAVNTGGVYQDLSILTGGLRFPLCEPGNYDVIFNEVARGVIDVAGLPCSYALPEPPAGEELDAERVIVTYTPGDANDTISFARVNDVAACTANSWYLTGQKEIALCATTCGQVKQDAGGAIQVRAACEGPDIK